MPFADLPHGQVTSHEQGGCWVCAVKVASFNNHHIIPRNAGGTKGPQVKICSACHDGLHHAAKLGLQPEDYSLRPDAKQKWLTLESRQRAAFLINLVNNTERLASQSENKTTAINLVLTGEEDRKLTYMSKRMGMSKAAIIKSLISSATLSGFRASK